jgi:alpha-galactosidase/6-phospho-beta-glucosidase family protein
VQEGIQLVSGLLGIPAQELDCVWIGTNHYHWFTRVCHRGKDMMPEVWRRAAEEPAPPHEFSNRLSRIYQVRICYPSDDHIVEFYPFLAQVRDFAELPESLRDDHFMQDLMPYYTGKKSMAEYAAECARVPRERVLAEYGEKLKKAQLPKGPDDPLADEGLARIIASIAHGRRTVCILNVPNGSSVPNLPKDALLETECVTDSCGYRTLSMGDAPRILKGMLEKWFAWQECVAAAAVKGDRRMALQAMMLDETAILPDKSEAMLNELLENSRGMLPQFGM